MFVLFVSIVTYILCTVGQFLKTTNKSTILHQRQSEINMRTRRSSLVLLVLVVLVVLSLDYDYSCPDYASASASPSEG